MPKPLYNYKIDIWRQSDTLNLGRHFKKYGRDSQFSRLSALRLDEKDFTAMFNTGEIKSFDIMFGLDQPEPSIDEFTFRPILTVKHKSRTSEIEFQQVVDKDVKGLSDSVKIPFVMLEWLKKNWSELDSNNMGDVFMAALDSQPGNTSGNPVTMRTKKRLLGYHFNSKINSNLLLFINQKRKSITQFIMHLGVDMNKYDHRDQFSFSPIFEIRVEQLTKNDLYLLHTWGIRSCPALNEQATVYFEYSSPCPSSCP